MRKRPLLFGACVFVIGILSARYKGWYYPAAVVVLMVYGLEKLFREKKWKRLLVRGSFIACLLVLAWFHMGHRLRFREEELSHIKAGEELLLKGEVYKKESKNGQFVFYLKNCTAAISGMEIPCNHVISYLEADTYSIGETLIIKGKVNIFSSVSNEGQFDIRAFYESQKIDFSLSDTEVLMTDGKKDFVGERLYRLRKKIGNVYEAVLNEAQKGLLSVMLLGEKSGLDSEMRQLYQEVGISHILAISGLHVSMIGMGLYRFLRRHGRGFTSAFLFSAVFLFLYAGMTGNSVSTLRAVGMLFFAMFAAVLGRSYDPLNALGGMVLFLLWENPFWLWYSGFQFSVVAILGITVIGTWLQIDPAEKEDADRKESAGQKEAVGQRENLNRGGNRIVFNVSSGHSNKKSLEKSSCETRTKRKNACFANKIYAGAAVWIATLPLVAFYYFEIPTYSVAINLLVLPLLPVLFFCGMAGGLAGCIWIPAARILLYPCSLVLHLYDFLANIFLKLPFSGIIVGKPSAAKIVVVYLALLAFTWFWYKKRRGHLKRILGIAAVLFLFFLPKKHGFEVDVLDVGQGDGIYLCSENGVSMFIDGGSSSTRNVGTYRILPFLKSKGVSHISYWFVTHADTDHVNGLKEIMESGYRIDRLVVAEAALAEAAMDELVALARSYGIGIVTIRAGDKFVFCEDTITCLYPAVDTQNEDKNDLSLVLLYESENFSGIFTGDISSEVEAELLESAGGLEKASSLGGRSGGGIDFYKAAHHGSKYSNSLEFLSELCPEIAVVSCSSTNNYGHPSAEAVANMEAVGAEIYYTMKQGQIRITVDRSGNLLVAPFLDDLLCLWNSISGEVYAEQVYL